MADDVTCGVCGQRVELRTDGLPKYHRIGLVFGGGTCPSSRVSRIVPRLEAPAAGGARG